MAISPINITRVSQNFQADFLLQTLRQSQRNMYNAEAQISTGRTFVNPSDDPVAASRVLNMTQALARQNQYASNAQYGDNFLSAADSALTEVNGLLVQASQIAIQTVGSLTTSDERASEAEVVASIRQQLQSIGNRQFNGRYIFGGRDVTNQPFIDALGGIQYVGDPNELQTRVADDEVDPISLPGSLLFGASTSVGNGANLSPSLTADTRLEDITGAAGGPIPAGTLVFNELGGAGIVRVDLSGADTIGKIVDAINAASAAANGKFTAAVGATGLTITPGALPVSVSDSGGGTLASALGILTTTPSPIVITGQTLSANVTRLTDVTALAAGAGIDLTDGFIITNGGKSVTVDVSTAKTVQDIINTINNAGVGVLARINAAHTGIEVSNQVSGTALSIGENGGTTATDLGIRTMDLNTPLSSLNFSQGVHTSDTGPDLRITAKDGSVVDVDLAGAVTVGDAIKAINDAATAATVSVQASLVTTGNGIHIADSTGGAGDLSVNFLNSQAASDLGIQQTITGTTAEIVGADVNLTRTNGILGALTDLERALRGNDQQGISEAGNRLDGLRNNVTRMHGVIGARSQAMSSKNNQIQDAVQTTHVFLSQIEDLDYAQAATRLQTASTALQASLQSSASIMQLTLLNYLH
ncbi:MAG: flagellar hook-associated protein FlgL [Planctomycetes bacterium]|nr:flagellar hook-associated protein FlgL [Planctomycetota bacterium]MBI3833891.1 flagellar hook-associated protein FlgL [Planctomycetota bacterium]